MNCYIWSILVAFYGAETLTVQKVDQKYLESFEMWCWRRMEKTGIKEERNTYIKYEEGRLTGLVISYVRTAF